MHFRADPPRSYRAWSSYLYRARCVLLLWVRQSMLRSEHGPRFLLSSVLHIDRTKSEHRPGGWNEKADPKPRAKAKEPAGRINSTLRAVFHDVMPLFCIPRVPNSRSSVRPHSPERFWVALSCRAQHMDRKYWKCVYSTFSHTRLHSAGRETSPEAFRLCRCLAAYLLQKSFRADTRLSADLSRV